MLPRHAVLLALCCVALSSLALATVWNWRAGLLTLLATCTGLFLGRLIFGAGRRSREAIPPTLLTRPQTMLAPLTDDNSAAGPLLEAALNGMREGVLVIDRAARVVNWNDAARAIFGGEAGGAPAARSLSVVTRNPAVHAAYRRALERGEGNEVKVELIGAERRVFDLRVVPFDLHDAHNTRCAIGVFFDITQLERLERVRQEFLSNVSHELRTPLTSILAFVETLEEGALDDPQHSRQFLSVIRKNAVRMHSLIEDILQLSAIESGTMSVDAASVRLRPLVQEVCVALAAKAAERPVTLCNQIAAGTLVWADPRRLEQMLINLIDNAIKFSRAGDAITITHKPGARDCISVTDTGEGIPAEHLPRIFERFYRVDRARARELGGTGLGLAIVKHLARAHGGEVTVESRPNAGSTFTIELPPVSPPPVV